MQHHNNYQPIYPQLAIITLKKFGMMSTVWLVYHLGITQERARKILLAIFTDYGNLILKSPDHLVTKPYEKWEVRFRKRKHISKWKDVTKP